MAGGNGKETVIEVRDVVVGFGDHVVLDRVNLDVYRGEILGFVGGSGAGKSVSSRSEAFDWPGASVIARKQPATTARRPGLKTCINISPLPFIAAPSADRSPRG